MERLIAFWKYLLSFQKTDWTLHDYPIRIKKHPQTDLDSPMYQGKRKKKGNKKC